MASRLRLTRRRRWLAGLAATVVVLVVVAVAVQPIRMRFVAAATMADALGLPMVRPFAADVERHATTIGGVDGDRYDSGRAAPPIVLVPGATPAGRQDARAVGLAEALARTGRTVFVPELALYGEDLVVDDIDRIVRVTAALADDTGRPVVLLGISFGGSLCLVAAADDRLDGKVEMVGTFGAYFDLVGVLQAATTGDSLVDGERIPWRADPRAEVIVQERLLELLAPLPRKEAEAALDDGISAAMLSRPARVAVELLENDDPALTYALAAELPSVVRDRIAAVSPSSVAGDLDVPVVAMHATDDPAVPHAELRRLGAALPEARLISVDSFEHVDLRTGTLRELPGTVADLWRVLTFATTILRAQ